jgi:hypothetical protein
MDLRYLGGPKPDMFQFSLIKTCVIVFSAKTFPSSKYEYEVYIGVLRHKDI